MNSEPNRSGEVAYPNEGFILQWNADGLEIKVTDYHAEVLKLPWKTVLDMAKQAGADLDEGD
jgi:hypothetical protein